MHARPRLQPSGGESSVRRSPEGTCSPGPAGLPTFPPAADVGAALVAMVTNPGRPRPRPRPLPRPPDVGARQRRRAPGWAQRSWRDGARSEPSGRRPSSAAPPASPRSRLQSAVSSSGTQHGHGGWLEALAARAGPGGVLRHRGHAGQGQLRRGEAGAAPDHQDGGAARARRGRPRRGFGRGAVFREGRLPRGPGRPRSRVTSRGERAWDCGPRRCRGSGPGHLDRVPSNWKPDQSGLCLPYATPGGHAEFRPEPSPLA